MYITKITKCILEENQVHAAVCVSVLLNFGRKNNISAVSFPAILVVFGHNDNLLY